MTTANTPAQKPARKRATDPEFATRCVNPVIKVRMAGRR